MKNLGLIPDFHAYQITVKPAFAGCTPQLLRHGFTTQLLGNTIIIKFLQELLRRKAKQTTKRYMQVSQKILKIIEALVNRILKNKNMIISI